MQVFARGAAFYLLCLMLSTDGFSNKRVVESFSRGKKKQGTLKRDMSPDASELMEQKRESFSSLEDFHEGVWTGRSASFGVSSDALAGMIKRKECEKYRSCMNVKEGGEESDPKKDRYGSMMETLSWGEEWEKIATRSIPLGESMDVDSVDGSYSCDMVFQRGDIPSDISGTSAFVKFGIEHCLVLNDRERVRCFVLYGVDDTLLRVVVCEETRASSSNDQDTASLTSNPQQTAIHPMDLLQRLSSSNQDIHDYQGHLRRCPMSIFTLVSGLWLGDIVIRDHSLPSSLSSNGFSSPAAKLTKDPFALWSTGVQKIAISYTWDYGTTLRQRYHVGRSIGTLLSNQIPNLSMGTILRPTKSSTPKMPNTHIFIDFDMGRYAAFLLGSILIKVPRFLNFSHKKRKLQPFYTDIAVFLQKSTTIHQHYQTFFQQNQQNSSMSSSTLPDIVCAKLSRLYNASGKLHQGTTSFYHLKRHTVEQYTGETDSFSGL